MRSALIALCVSLLVSAGIGSAATPAASQWRFQERQINTLKGEVRALKACFGSSLLPITTRTDIDGTTLWLAEGSASDSVYVPTIRKACAA